MGTIDRPRACAAILRHGSILMVHHRHHDHTYWTLPGGGVMEGESLEQTVIREVWEETQLVVQVERFLFKEPYAYGTSYCFLATAAPDAIAQLGQDPEEAEVTVDLALLQGVAWHPLETMQHDQQVSKVIAILGLSLESEA